eukprot:3270916-Rhodomonas_salina.2
MLWLPGGWGAALGSGSLAPAGETRCRAVVGLAATLGRWPWSVGADGELEGLKTRSKHLAAQVSLPSESWLGFGNSTVPRTISGVSSISQGAKLESRQQM